MVALRHYNNEEEVKRLARKIDAMALSADKQAALSRMPTELRDRVEHHLQLIYHHRQQQFESNKEIADFALKIADLKSRFARKHALDRVPLEIRSDVEKCVCEIFSQRKQKRGINAETA